MGFATPSAVEVRQLPVAVVVVIAIAAGEWRDVRIRRWIPLPCMLLQFASQCQPDDCCNLIVFSQNDDQSDRNDLTFCCIIFVLPVNLRFVCFCVNWLLIAWICGVCFVVFVVAAFAYSQMSTIDLHLFSVTSTV